MADPFVAEIRVFSFGLAPAGWAFCDGQLIPVAQNTTLFGLLGTTYGGDGVNNFALPNLQGRAPMHPRQGPGLSQHVLGESGGADGVALTPAQLPAHSHAPFAAPDAALVKLPGSTVSMARSRNGNAYQDNTSNLVSMNAEAIAVAGGGQAHNNLQPYLTLNFCIAMQGVVPSS